MIRFDLCSKCGKSFQYDPWVDNIDLCPDCLQATAAPKPNAHAATAAGFQTSNVSEINQPPHERVRTAPTRTDTKLTSTTRNSVHESRKAPSFVEKGENSLRNTLKSIAGEKFTEEILPEYIGKSRILIDEFRQTDFRNEILSHDKQSARAMLRNSTFWIAMFMGVLPLLVSAFSEGEKTLYGLLFFFAVMWAGIFKGFVLVSVAPIKFPIMAFFFTGVIGIGGLLLYHELLPGFYLKMNESSSHLLSLLGYVLQTGLNEEICKLVPVVLFIVIKRRNWSVEEVLLIGVFSGLGFATFENIHYALSFAERSASSVYSSVYRDTAALRAYSGTISSMTYIMIRSLSCLFGHAVYTGIATCFVISGILLAKGRVVKFFLALAVPAIIHGCYNWFASRVPLGSALVNAAAFALFFGYLLRTRLIAAELNRDDPYVEEVEGEYDRKR